MRFIPWIILVSLLACTPPDAAPHRSAEKPSVPPEAPAGATEADQGPPFRQVLARARSLEANRRPIQALQLYRTALATAPTEFPRQEYESLQEHTRRLSFLLGIPDASLERSRLRSHRLSTEDSDDVRKASALYAQAIRAQDAGEKARAITLYRETLRSLQESQNKELYWNAWQRLDDLAPGGAQPPTTTMADPAESERNLEEALFDGSLVAVEPNERLSARAPAQRLSQARARYIKGMDYARAKDNSLARRAFQDVLILIRESQDPELYRAARQNLVDLNGEGQGQ